MALCPKSYFAQCYQTKDTKDGRKGIPMWAKLRLNDFKQKLYNTTPGERVEVRSLRLDRDKHMSRTTLNKKGLSAVHVKLRVAQDKVTCLPLKNAKNEYE